MIETSKQQQLVFDKGITCVPSDAICSDNTLEESLGLVNVNGEHRVIQQPVPSSYTIPNGHTLLFIHKLPNVNNAISSYGGYACYGATQLMQVSGNNIQVTAIGKTLIILDDNGLHYFLWKQVTNQFQYVSLPPIPAIDIEFSLHAYKRPTTEQQSPYPPERNDEPLLVHSLQSLDGVMKLNAGTYELSPEDKQEDYNNALIGLYAENKKKIAKEKGFCLPFFARAALEMYDGSYSHISNPVLLLPSTTNNSWGAYNNDSPGGVRPPWVDDFILNTYGCRLRYKLNNSNYSLYSDIVKNVVIFITRGIELYDTGVDQPNLTPGNAKTNGIYTINMDSSVYGDEFKEITLRSIGTATVSNCSAFYNQPLKAREVSEINDEIKNASVFRKLCSVGISPTQTHKLTSDLFSSTLLENLDTQEQLEIDDYYSNAPLKPTVMSSYNSRLLLANVERGVFDGYHFFSPYAGTLANHSFLVTIETDSGTLTAVHNAQINTKQGLYFFYPDRRAKRAIIDGNEVTLTEHPSLNGAYYFAGLPRSGAPTMSDSGSQYPISSSGTEYLQNTLILSEANNPFSFNAMGYYTVGMGIIKGVSTLTTALSQGQFGQFPLIVFSTEGIWAMSVASTGYFSDAVPMSREVCNNPKSITQTDGAVFFSSDKGLMEIAGSIVRCVSEQLSGKSPLNSLLQQPFADFIAQAKIAYDYRDSLLWIVDSQNSVCWIYSIKSGTFSHYFFGENTYVTAIVNDYPDYLLQIGGTIYSLLTRPNANEDPNYYAARLVTRPMKLENALALKRIKQIRNIRDMNASATVALTIKATNVLTNSDDFWQTLSSLRGRPWGYYRFQYDFNNIKATDSFAGSVVVTEEVRDEKLRLMPYDKVGAGEPVVPQPTLPDQPTEPAEFTLNEPLRSLNSGIGSPTYANAILVYDGQRWTYEPKPTGGGGTEINIEGATMQAVWDALAAGTSEPINISHIQTALQEYMGTLLASYSWWGQTFPQNSQQISGPLYDVSFIQFTNGVKLGVDSTAGTIRVYMDDSVDPETQEPVTNPANFYVTGGSSALGNSPGGGGGGGGGGATYLPDLSDIDDNLYSGIQNGYVLTYDSANSRWKAAPPQGGGTTSVFGVNVNGLVPGPSRADTTLFLRADGTWDVPAGGGGGTVTSVGLSVPTGLIVNPQTITSSGTFVISLDNGYSIPSAADVAKGVAIHDAAFWGQHINNGKVSGEIFINGGSSVSGSGSGIYLFNGGIGWHTDGTAAAGSFATFGESDYFNPGSNELVNQFNKKAIFTQMTAILNGLWIQNASQPIYATGFNCLRIGDAVLSYNATDSVLMLQKADGSAAHFCTLGGVSALGASTGGSVTDLTISHDLTIGHDILFTTGGRISGPANTNLFIGNEVGNGGSVCFSDIQSQQNDSSRSLFYWSISQNGYAKFQRLYLDSDKYLCVENGILKFINGNTVYSVNLTAV